MENLKGPVPGLTVPAASQVGPAEHGAAPTQSDRGQTPRRRRWPARSSGHLGIFRVCLIRFDALKLVNVLKLDETVPV